MHRTMGVESCIELNCQGRESRERGTGLRPAPWVGDGEKRVAGIREVGGGPRGDKAWKARRRDRVCGRKGHLR